MNDLAPPHALKELEVPFYHLHRFKTKGMMSFWYLKRFIVSHWRSEQFNGSKIWRWFRDKVVQDLSKEEKKGDLMTVQKAIHLEGKNKGHIITLFVDNDVISLPYHPDNSKIGKVRLSWKPIALKNQKNS